MRIEFAMSAKRPSGVMAMLDGGPTTELGTSGTCRTAGGNVEKSRMLIESGAASGTGLGNPVVRSILFSFPEMTMTALGTEEAERLRTMATSWKRRQRVRSDRMAGV